MTSKSGAFSTDTEQNKNEDYLYRFEREKGYLCWCQFQTMHIIDCHAVMFASQQFNYKSW